MMKITNILVLLLISMSCKSSNLNTLFSKDVEKIDLLSASILIDMPLPFHVDIEHYDEGVIYIYSLNDGGHILIHEGALMQFDWDFYIPSNVMHYKNYSIYTGETGSMAWGKYICSNIRIYYFNVKAKDKRKYDKILKTVKIL